MDGNAPINHLAQAVQDKKPVPEIDFTLHTMEDGNQVSTQERVCKGIVQQRARGIAVIDVLAKMSKRQPFTPPAKISFSLHRIEPNQTSNFSSNTSIVRAV